MEKTMSEKILAAPVELTDAELDLVVGGAKQEGLVNVNVEDAVKDINVGVAAQALTANSSQTFRQIT
jgi:hypothetical protein